MTVLALIALVSMAVLVGMSWVDEEPNQNYPEVALAVVAVLSNLALATWVILA
jgi:hypothetical protein